MYVARLSPGERVEHALAPARKAWVHVALGDVGVNGERLTEGDGVALEGEPLVVIEASARSEILLFDLP
jgi:redox-sensitive bicupin YhaK (pirin superfamily)